MLTQKSKAQYSTNTGKTIPPPHMKSDAEIISQIVLKKAVGWANLYDKYAAVMYGFILQLTEETAVADEILLQSFLGLKLDSSLLRLKKTLCIGILVHTHTYALKILHKRAIMPKTQHSLQELVKKFCINEAQSKN